uniref:Uncharacterized protein n=1 Tax=Sphaerodactylus townsendi TaxID=933632 RepID=A0ACB8EFD1_9SAUR
MAAEGAQKELCEEASCSVCLAFFRDPVMIPECGHTFCRACLTHSWGALEGAEASCPQCRGPAKEGTLRPNYQLANLVKIIQKLSPLEGSVKKRKRGVCELHQEPLELFCQEDEGLLCLVCSRSREHRDHRVIPLEEASQEKRNEFCNCLKILKKKREEIVTCKVDIVKESQDMMKQTTEQKQETVAKFRELHTFLEGQENRLLAQMEEVEEVMARKRNQHLTELSEVLSSLDSLTQEMEEKCQQPASELLQGARSILQRFEKMEQFKNPLPLLSALKWQLWDLSNLNCFWERFMKQVKANVTLDPNTAHPSLILSADQKSVTQGEEAQDLPNNPERFDHCCAVLGLEEFTGGRHFWDVHVGSEEGWAVGVARKSVKRKGVVIFSPKEGIWSVEKWRGGEYTVSMKGNDFPPSLFEDPKRIRVCLNYDGGRVSFFDADRGALIYEFSGASFSGEILLPFFYVYKKGHLKLFS